MEALDTGSKQSGIHSIINRDHPDRINTDRTYTSAPSMAATAVASPASSIYSIGPPPPYTSGWSAPAPHSVSGLISPPEFRRTSDSKAEPPPSIQTGSQHRQSLPSIHEALSSGPKPNPYASPVSASLPASHQQVSFPPSQAPSIPRSYPSEPYHSQGPPSQPKQPSPPQPVHPHPAPFSHPDTIPVTFSEAARNPSVTSLQTAPVPPINPYAGPRYESPRYEESRGPERGADGYTHYPPPHHGPHQYAPGPNQPPYNGPSYDPPSYPPRGPRDPRDPSEAWKGGRENVKMAGPFAQGLKRHLDVWDFENSLSEINKSSEALRSWSHHFHAIAQEQQRSVNAIPDRMPTLESCKEMIEHNHKIFNALRRMEDVLLQEHALADQRMRERAGREYDDEMSLYGDDMKNQGFGVSEAKKRRGRAAPPGRCHSCNRAETPEWRRGPDGARTLCNACGLHYAKLTRKNTLKQQSQAANGSSLRPKSMDEHSPRPL